MNAYKTYTNILNLIFLLPIPFAVLVLNEILIMNLKEEEAAQLLKRYRMGHCTENEKAMVEDWYMHFNEDEADSAIKKDLEKIKARVLANLPHSI